MGLLLLNAWPFIFSSLSFLSSQNASTVTESKRGQTLFSSFKVSSFLGGGIPAVIFSPVHILPQNRNKNKKRDVSILFFSHGLNSALKQKDAQVVEVTTRLTVEIYLARK